LSKPTFRAEPQFRCIGLKLGIVRHPGIGAHGFRLIADILHLIDTAGFCESGARVFVSCQTVHFRISDKRMRMLLKRPPSPPLVRGADKEDKAAA